MQHRTVTLVKFSSQFTPLTQGRPNSCKVSVSHTLNHLWIKAEDQHASLYSCIQNTDSSTCLKCIWRSSSEIQSCSFSDDGTQLLVLGGANDLRVLDLQADTAESILEVSSSQLSALFSDLGIGSSHVVPLLFSGGHATLFVDEMWLVVVMLRPLDVVSLSEVTSSVGFARCKGFLYSLTKGGNVSAYPLEGGPAVATLNLYSLLVRGPGAVDVLTSLALSEDGSFLAVSDIAGRVFVTELGFSFPPTDTRWDGEQSNVSTRSGISRLTTASFTSSVTRGSVSASVVSYEVTPTEKPVSYRSGWKSYIASLSVGQERESRPEISLLPCQASPPPGMVLGALSLTPAGLGIWYGGPLGGLYRLYNINSGTLVAQHDVGPDTTLLPRGCLAFVDMFVSPDRIYLFLANLSKEVFVNKLLHCVEAENIGPLLQGEEWGDLGVPVSALADALKHCQMDVARLALTLHAQAFKSMLNAPDMDPQCTVTNLNSSTDELLDTIHEAVVACDRRVAFSEQLVILALHHCNLLLGLLHSPDAAWQPATHCIMGHVVRLRSFLREVGAGPQSGPSRLAVEPCDPAVSVGQEVLPLSPELGEVWSRWSAQDDMSVVRDAVENDLLPLATTLLCHARQLDGLAVKKLIEHHVRDWGQELLEGGNLKRAWRILTNFGCDADEELVKICLTTLDSSLRDNLAAHLMAQQLLNDVQIQALEFLQRVETIVHGLPANFTSFSQPMILEQYGAAIAKLPTMSQGCWRLSIGTVCLQSEDWRSAVLAELLLVMQDQSLHKSVRPMSVWSCLLQYNRTDLLSLWIDTFYCEGVADRGGLPGLFSTWPITRDLIDSIYTSDATSTTKQHVLDHLARFGAFCQGERTNVGPLLMRLSRIGSLDRVEQVLDRSSANVSSEQFYSLLATFCTEHRLYGVLTSCLGRSRHSVGEAAWPGLWRQFGEVNSERALYRSAVETGVYLAKGDLATYLQGHPLLTVALVVLGQQSLLDAPGDLHCLDDAMLQTAVSQLPLLDHALAKCEDRPPDVTVYELLQGCTMFDVSKLFRWQTTHSSKLEELPQFLLPQLVTRFGHRESLTYLHYLRQERPSFAVNLFIMDQLRAHGKLSRKMRQQACCWVHGLALQHLSDPGITAACSVFVESLGGHSDWLRVHVGAANVILSHLNFLDPAHTVLHRHQVGTLMKDLTMRAVQTRLLSLLELGLEHSCSVHPGADLAGSLLNWQLPVQFARIHGLELPDRFLQLCAKQNMWLGFVLYAQLYQFPLEQVLALCQQFGSRSLGEHLGLALQYNRGKTRGHSASELRLRYAHKVLSARKVQHGGETALEVGCQHIGGSSSSSEESYSLPSPVLELAAVGADDDVFLTLLSCNSSPDPPRALLSACHTQRCPLLAVLAACYEPSSVLACYCCWLLVSLPAVVATSLCEELGPVLQHDAWTAERLELLLERAVTSGHIAMVARGLAIFLPESPLRPLAEFLQECVQQKKFQESIITAKQFKAACLNLTGSLLVGGSDGEFLNNRRWVASVAVRLVCLVLATGFSSAFQEQRFLWVLCESSFTDHLQVAGPNLAHLLRLAECLSGTGVTCPWAELCRGKPPREQQVALERCLSLLLSSQQFQPAMQFASLAGLPSHPVLLAKLSHKFEQTLEDKSDLINFWDQCQKAFTRAGMDPRTAALFYQQCSLQVQENKHRYHVLSLALTWFRATRTDMASPHDREEDSVELEMWRCWLQEDSQLPEKQCPDTPSLKADVLVAAGVATLATRAELQSPAKLDSLIGQLLDRGDLVTACRVQAMFGHSNKDLHVLLTCMDLAEGRFPPYELPMDLRLLLTESRDSAKVWRRTFQSLRLASFSSAKSEGVNSTSTLNISQGSDSMDAPDTVSLLEQLSEKMDHGAQLGSWVTLCYSLASNLGQTYQDLAGLKEPITLLRLCPHDAVNKFVLAGDLVRGGQLSADDLAALLCDEMVAALAQGEGTCSVWGCDLSTNLHLVVELCPDPAVLGDKLLSRAVDVLQSDPTGPCNVHGTMENQAVELMIWAHDCFTAGCNMEGISATLRKVRGLATSLQHQQQWTHMVRLLTGIGRYTEMRYIFQILKDNEQFESLLGKGLDKVPGLKMAVLDFLKQSCCEDRELFRLVALHFSMYGQVAALWEEEGQTVLCSLAARSLCNDTETRTLLETAMLSFGHASEYYQQANKLTRAIGSRHNAELAALQLFLVTSAAPDQAVDCLLGLNPHEVAHAISHTLSFPQACIVSRAYNQPADWGAALFQQVVVQADPSYLADFTHNMTLTTALLEDIAGRFQVDQDPTPEMTRQMTTLVSCATCVEVKYRVASQLGLRPLLEGLLNGPEVPYLKDTVWCSGFR